MKNNTGPRFSAFYIEPPTPAAIAAATRKALRPDQLSSDQSAVFDKVMAWVRHPNKPFLTLGGLAGTGKTTLVATIASELGAASVAFCAFTGKAATVLGRKLRDVGVLAGASTIHSLIYRPVHHKCTPDCAKPCNAPETEFDLVEMLPGVELIIVDEASMLSTALWEDLRSFGIPILAVGDHGQLPPVGSDNPGLMTKPDLCLEQIHRQAADNPIITLAHHIRAGGRIQAARMTPGDTRVRQAKSAVDALTMLGGKDAVAAEVLNIGLICGKNSTRVRLNEAIRKLLGYSGNVPDPGEILIALRNFPPVFNGLRGRFEGPTSPNGYSDTNKFGAFKGRVVFPDDNLIIDGEINYHQFGVEKTFSMTSDIPSAIKPSNWRQAGLLFDYGYAITCHKSQGSQYTQTVVLTNDLFGDSEFRKRWLYTAVTRASERLILI